MDSREPTRPPPMMMTSCMISDSFPIEARSNPLHERLSMRLVHQRLVRARGDLDVQTGRGDAVPAQGVVVAAAQVLLGPDGGPEEGDGAAAGSGPVAALGSHLGAE